MKNNIRLVVDKLFYTPIGQLITSVIFGLALALLFRRICKENCTLYFAPYIEEIKGKIFKLEDTCYKYTPYIVNCNVKQDILNPYDIGVKPENKIITYKSNIMDN